MAEEALELEGGSSDYLAKGDNSSRIPAILGLSGPVAVSGWYSNFKVRELWAPSIRAGSRASADLRPVASMRCSFDSQMSTPDEIGRAHV